MSYFVALQPIDWNVYSSGSTFFCSGQADFFVLFLEFIYCRSVGTL